ncbi:MAG: TIGR01777 family oxidoreductase [Acidimicrobiales bacterium]
MRIAVTGSHGLVARHMVPALTGAGHQVVPVVRDSPGPGQLRWDPAGGHLDPGVVGADAVVNLAGVGIAARRWSADHKARVLDSRVRGTSLVAGRIADAGPDHRPRVLVNASAIGWYGDRGEEILDESSPAGLGYLPELCQLWERATAPAADAGVRTVVLRSGIVLAGDGGALAPQLKLFKTGLGGRLGDGSQWTSWISIADEVGAILHALETESLSGPVNLVAPEPVRNSDFTACLGKVLGRPTRATVPAIALRAVLGREMADELVLTSQRVTPAVLDSSGFAWRHRDLDSAVRAAIAG